VLIALIVMQPRKDDSNAMAPTPAIELSDDLLALFSRAELASARARSLIDENDRWRRSVLQQLDYMFELGAEFRRPRRETTRP
jgi:hypothetical protein